MATSTTSPSDLSPDAWRFLQGRVAEFENAWSTGERPRIETFCPQDPADDPTEGWLLPELVHAELEFRIHAGETARVEDYLGRYPVLLLNRDIVAALLETEFVARLPSEPELSPVEYGRRFPNHVDHLMRQTLREDADTKPSAVDAYFAEAAPTEDQISSANAHRHSTEDTATGESDAFAPSSIGRFKIERILGQGGFGVVYLAVDPSLGRRVAVKVPQPHILARSDLRERFLREARAAAALDHPNIIPLYEAIDSGSHCYLVSSYCPGQDLAKWLSDRTEPVPTRMAAELVAALADAVQYSHDRGILHRDLKPANVMLAPDTGESETSAGLSFIPRLTDFGLAKVVDASLHETRSSILLGTPTYMAPEQAAGSDGVGPPADLYSLGVILYEILSGRPPFTGSLSTVLASIRDEAAERPSRLRPDLPRDLENICLKCLRKEPSQRYGSVGDLADDLRRFLNGQAVLAKPESWRERVTAWCRRSERLRDAALLSLVINFVVMAWTWGNHFAWLTGLTPIPEQVDQFTRNLGSVTTTLTMHVPMFVIAINTLRRRAWSVPAGLVVSSIMLVSVTAVLTNVVHAFGGLYDDPLLRASVFTNFVLLFGIQLAGYIVAWIALRAERDSCDG